MNRYLDLSPVEQDERHLIGRHSTAVPVDLLRALGHSESPLKAIRAMQ